MVKQAKHFYFLRYVLDAIKIKERNHLFKLAFYDSEYGDGKVSCTIKRLTVKIAIRMMIPKKRYSACSFIFEPRLYSIHDFSTFFEVIYCGGKATLPCYLFESSNICYW